MVTETGLPLNLEGWFALALFVIAGEFALLTAVFEQRHRRRSAETLLAKNQEKLQFVSSSTSCGFWRWDATTREISATRYARRILGLDEEARLVPVELLARVDPSDRAAVVEAITGKSQPRDTVELEFRIVLGEGERRWITAKARTYRDAKGAVQRTTGYVIDDSDRKRVGEELLEQRQKLTYLTRIAMLGELSGSVGHKLGEFLTSILCNAQAAQILLTKADMDVQALKVIFQDIVSDDEDAGQLIKHVRALLIPRGTNFERVEFGPLLRDTLAVVAGVALQNNIQLTSRIAEGIPAVYGDRVELQQMVINLVVNACKSMSTNAPDDRRMEIVAEHDADEHIVRISVLGCGRRIGPEQFECILDRFVTKSCGGFSLEQGLLTACLSIMDTHKGRLWAEDRSGHGQAFHFTVPIAVEEERNGQSTSHGVHC
jgi:C4-dicarboxylate-specific signal transduction histidine kinase